MYTVCFVSGWNGALPEAMCHRYDVSLNETMEPVSLTVSSALFITSPNYPFFYDIAQSCLWLLQTGDDQIFRIEFLRYFLVSDLDTLTIGEGHDHQDETSVIFHRGRFMNTHVMYSASSRIWILWTPHEEGYNFSDDTFVSWEYWMLALAKHASGRGDYVLPFWSDPEANDMSYPAESFMSGNVSYFVDGSDDVVERVNYGMKLIIESVSGESK